MTLRALLRACCSLSQLKQVHGHLLKLHPPPPSSSSSSPPPPPPSSHAISALLLFQLFTSYALSPHGDLSYAKALFTLLPFPTVLHWNTLIRALSSGANPAEALSAFRSMLRSGAPPNNFTYPFVLKACAAAAAVGASYCGMVHARVVAAGLELDPYVQSSLIHMYSQGKDLAAATRVFDGCSCVDTVCWNAMLDGYVKAGELVRARGVFDKMESRDVVSWNTMINGYALMEELNEAQELFDQMPMRNVVSWNSMLAGYSKCGDVNGARRVFSEMPRRDVVSWNSMLACLAQSGNSDEALLLFEEMKRMNVKPTDATLVSLLSACTHLGTLDQGERIHKYIKARRFTMNTILSTALVDMYSKCGSLLNAKWIFRAIKHKDLLAWNTILAGVAIHGHVEEALKLFEEMVESGIRPDDATFVMLLSACSHSGMVNQGRQLLHCMKDTYGIDPKVEHYGCVIDLLSRAGFLEEAMELTGGMPMEPNAPAWGALLGGCRIHGNSEVAAKVAKQLLNLQPGHSGRYVLLSNIYATANQWENATKVRSTMLANSVSKIPGMSMIELDGIANQFVAGDRSHAEAQNIYKKLTEIAERLKVEAGYTPDTREVALDIEEEEKELALLAHSERLAIALGLLKMNEETTIIRIVKNLRVCNDCHHVTKLISKCYGREIIMRDRNRFHIFKDGACSCMDYW